MNDIHLMYDVYNFRIRLYINTYVNIILKAYKKYNHILIK